MGTGTVKRSDFGLGFAAPVVSDEVKLTINAAFTA
jgi:polyisoprenoid-binding protein YceI